MNSKIIQKLRSIFTVKNLISRYSLFVGRIDGVPIYINFSFAFTFLLITWILSDSILPTIYPGIAHSTYIIIGTLCAIISLFSILLHEVGHSVVAGNYGIKFERIVIFALGGIASNPIEISVPKQEIFMAFAGPITSFIISGLSLAVWFIIYQSGIISLENFPFETILFYGGMVNLIIGLFNLLPIFPSDGGRILRSFLSYYTHDHFKATRDAIRVGMIISFSMFTIGAVVGLLFSFVSGIWLMLVAFFLMRGSRFYYNQYQNQHP